MFDRNELQTLVEFRGENVLSVYLDTDLAHRSKDAVKLLFRDTTKVLEAEAPNQVDAVKKYLDYEYDWQSRGLAIFAAGDALWKTFPLPIPVSVQAFLMDRPYVRVLTDVLDRFGKYGVALLDRESVRLFSVAGARIQSETESIGEELKRHKQGGWAAARYERHEDNLALHNLKQAVEVTQTFCETTHCERLMLAGNSDVLSQFKDLMPKALQGRLIGEFSAAMEAPAHEILERSQSVAAQADWNEEQILVAEAITAASKGGAGVTGLTDTLYALHQGQVRELLVEESYRASGYLCEYCGHIAAEPMDTCPLCNYADIVETPDAVNRAIHKALETGAHVNIVRENEKLIQAGGIAARLRY